MFDLHDPDSALYDDGSFAGIVFLVVFFGAVVTAGILLAQGIL